MALSDFFDIHEATLDDKIKRFIEHMDFLQTMDVRELTLYKKYKEINGYYRTWYDYSQVIKARVWRPTNTTLDGMISEIESLQPQLRYIGKDDRDGIDEWTTLRVFVSSFEFDQNPGRFMRFILEDQHGNYLGVTSIGSDIMNLGPRDRYIGWTDEIKEGGMLNHLAIGTTIVPTQPFGYNFLGGKLLASMLVTSKVRDAWQREYNNILVGLTTTSLYGDGSMYNGIKWWKSMGESSGRVTLKPNEDVYKEMHAIVKEKYADEYVRVTRGNDNKPTTGVKQRIMNMIYKECGITTTKYQHGFRRGVYFAPIYDNTNDFLCKRITEEQLKLKSTLQNDIDDVLRWWKPKAISRIIKLHNENRCNFQNLFYNDAMFMEWDEFKDRYLKEVGR